MIYRQDQKMRPIENMCKFNHQHKLRTDIMLVTFEKQIECEQVVNEWTVSTIK